MPEGNVETVRRALEAFNESGFGSEGSLGFFAEDAVFEEPPEQPAPRVARGRDAAAELFEQFDAAWEEHRSEPQELRVLDEDRVLMLSIEHFRGRDGLVVDQPAGTIFTLRDGLIVRMQSFWEQASALEAATRST